LYVVHGGSDFDKINPSRFGSGEPGGIRPLGKGLYSFVIDHEDPKRAAYAIDYAKHYSKKYGYGDKAVHVFKIPKSISTSWNGDNDDNTKFPRYPRKIEGLGGYPEKELAEYRAINDKYKAVKGTPEEGDSWLYSNRAYERLRQAADVQFQHLPIGLTEASIHNPEVATRIGKFDLDTPTEDILGMVKNDATNVPHKEDGGRVMDTAIHKGKPFWSGVFDANDGFIREVHPYKRAKAADFHHSYYVSSQSQDAMKQGDAGFFWVDPDGSVNTDWREGSAPKHIVDAIQDQIEPIPHKDNGGGITAYHSSPHDFDEFDTAKIGTGEGNQMYGHGLYFAENPEVSGQGGQYYNQFMNKMKSSPERHATAALWANKFDRDKAIASLDRSHAYHSDQAIPGRYANGPDAEEGDRLLAEEYKEGADHLRSGKIAGPRTYEVSINAHQDHMLDWDKTIDEQSDYVKNALNKTEWWPWTKERIEDRSGRHGANPQGRHVYNDLSEDYSLEEATNFLQDAGIKGVRYLDAGSRDSGKGTHNYVVFDHKNVNVKRKYKDGGEVDDGITAYHGSPHDFDQFDMAKIGKGVGEQAYGHGLYFTEHEPTAIDFRDRATASKNINDFNLYRISGSNEEFEPQKQGHMYEVNINAHPDHMLDWNKPLSEQSPYIVKSIFDSRKDNPTLFNVFKSHFEKDSTGMDFYQALATQHPNGYQGASEFLQRSGVHGVKYRDENSRDKGKGTTNYVVFDPKNVDVKRKYEQGGEVLPHDDSQREENLAAFQEGNHPDVPHVLYHGTKRNFDTFNLNAPPAGDSGVQMGENRDHTDVGFFGKGFYFAGPNAASGYSEYGKPEESSGPNVMPVHLSMKNPFIVTHPDSSSGAMAMQHSLARLGHGHITSPTAQTELLKKLGHDGVIAARTEDGKTTPYEWVAFHPHQIKSAIGNNGNFDPSKPKITEARGGRIGYDYGGDVRTGDNPGGAADANRSAVTSRDANRNYNAGSGTQTAGPSSNNRPDNRPDNSNDRFNIGGGGAPMPPQRGNDSFFGNMGGNIGSVLGGLAFGPLGSIGGRYLGNKFNQPDNSRFEAKNDEFGNPVGGGWLDFLGNSGNPPAPMTSDNRRDPIVQPLQPKCKIFNPDGSCKEFEGGMKSGGVAKSYNQVHNSKIVKHALSKVGVSLHTHRPPS